MTALRNLFGRGAPAPAAAPTVDAGLAKLRAEDQPAASPPPALEPASGRWPPVRLGLVEQLWGDGFLNPGGGAEMLRLAVPMGLSEASSLLLPGGGRRRAAARARRRTRHLGGRL